MNKADNFTLRTVSGLILLFLVIFCLYMAGYYFYFLMLSLSSIALYEMLSVLSNKKIDLIEFFVLEGINILILLGAYIKRLDLPLFSVFLLVALFLIYGVFDENFDIRNIFKLVFSTVYISVPIAFLLSLNGTFYAWMVFGCGFGTDTFAYLGGMFLGKHKLLERVSPKKTVEGALSGIAGCLATCLVLALILKFKIDLKFVFIAILGSVISQLGDLSASNIKRKIGIKDYGNIIKGHGGVIDRIDSILFVSSFIYFAYIIN